jgi:hypothetical protein
VIQQTGHEVTGEQPAQGGKHEGASRDGVARVQTEDGRLVAARHPQVDGFGARRDEMRDIFDGEGGWTGVLASFARTAES